jgi:transcriptional antiterminator NusG
LNIDSTLGKGGTNMSWYSLFVLTGKEEYVEEWLRLYFDELIMTILIPKRKLTERKQGKVRQVLKKMFPGYLLIHTEMNDQIYYAMERIPNLIRVLNSGEAYTPIPDKELECTLRLLDEKGIVDYSNVYVVNSKLVVKSGPLLGMEGLIKSVDKRKKRAKIMVPFMGLEKEIDVGIEMFDSK